MRVGLGLILILSRFLDGIRSMNPHNEMFEITIKYYKPYSFKSYCHVAHL